MSYRISALARHLCMVPMVYYDRIYQCGPDGGLFGRGMVEIMPEVAEEARVLASRPL